MATENDPKPPPHDDDRSPFLSNGQEPNDSLSDETTEHQVQKPPYIHSDDKNSPQPPPVLSTYGYVPPTPEQRHKDTVGLVYFFIVGVSAVLGSCGLLSSIYGPSEVPDIPAEKLEQRILRLYSTGYDTMMSTDARDLWIKHNNEPRRAEVVRIQYESGGPVVYALVKRDGDTQMDIISLTPSGTITRYTKMTELYIYEKHELSEVAIVVDPSVYPKSVDEIPEAFTK